MVIFKMVNENIDLTCFLEICTKKISEHQFKSF